MCCFTFANKFIATIFFVHYIQQPSLCLCILKLFTSFNTDVNEIRMDYFLWKLSLLQTVSTLEILECKLETER